LDEDAHDRVEALRHPCPIGYIGLGPLHLYAALSGQPPRLREGERRNVDSGHLTPELGEPDTVSTLAASDLEHAHAGPKQLSLRCQKHIGLRAEDVLRGRKALIPKRLRVVERSHAPQSMQ